MTSYNATKCSNRNNAHKYMQNCSKTCSNAKRYLTQCSNAQYNAQYIVKYPWSNFLTTIQIPAMGETWPVRYYLELCFITLIMCETDDFQATSCVWAGKPQHNAVLSKLLGLGKNNNFEGSKKANPIPFWGSYVHSSLQRLLQAFLRLPTGIQRA